MYQHYIGLCKLDLTAPWMFLYTQWTRATVTDRGKLQWKEGGTKWKMVIWQTTYTTTPRGQHCIGLTPQTPARWQHSVTMVTMVTSASHVAIVDMLFCFWYISLHGNKKTMQPETAIPWMPITIAVTQVNIA